jgi:hypothetical protein
MITVGPGIYSTTIEQLKLIIYEKERMNTRRRMLSSGKVISFALAKATPMQAISKMTGKIKNH